jgi:hypothetical protein
VGLSTPGGWEKGTFFAFSRSHLLICLRLLLRVEIYAKTLV